MLNRQKADFDENDRRRNRQKADFDETTGVEAAKKPILDFSRIIKNFKTRKNYGYTN